MTIHLTTYIERKVSINQANEQKNVLSHHDEQLETHGFILSIVTTGDALVLKHQAIIIHSADQIKYLLHWISFRQK